MGLCTPAGGGGGSSCSPNPIGPAACPAAGPAGLGGDSPAPGGGNPINFITGNKYQEEVDLPAMPGVLGLEFRRFYNSQSTHAGLVGARWRTSYETVLYDLGNQVQIVQADGRRLTFQRGTGGKAALCSSSDAADGQVRIEAPRHGSGSPTYHWRWPTGQTLTFSGGRGGGFPLQSITAPGGQKLVLSYSPTGELIWVRDPQGRKLTFVYGNVERAHALQAVDTPLGRIRFSQDTAGRLVEVAYGSDVQGGPALSKFYHYEDRYNGGNRFALTGISVRRLGSPGGQIAQERLSTYAYNATGQAVLSTKGYPKEMRGGKVVEGTGIDQIELKYVQKSLPTEGRLDKLSGEIRPAQLGKTVLQDRDGRTTEVLHAVIGGHFRLVEMRGPGCATCGETNVSYGYDAAGRVIRETRLGEGGRPLYSTITAYDEFGRVTRVGRQAATHGAGDRRTPVQWMERLVYRDLRYSDGSVGLSLLPEVVSRPSVAPGRDYVSRYRYGPPGSAFAHRPVEVTEVGWTPGFRSDGVREYVPITRTTRYRYVEQGPAAGELAERDGPLPNGPQGSPQDSDVTRLDYDHLGRLAKVTVPTGLIHSYRYDDLSRIQEEIPIDGIPVGRTYDPQGRIAIVQRAGVQMRAEWSATGQLLGWLSNDGKRVPAAAPPPSAASTDAQQVQHRSSLRLDPFGRVLEIEGLPDGSPGSLDATARRVTRFSYGPVEREPISIVDPAGVRTSRAFDDFGRVVRTVSPDTGTTTGRYDEADRPVEVIDASGRATRFEFDLLDRLIKRTETFANDAESVVFTYAGARLTAVIGRHEVSRFEWDERGRMASKWVRLGGGPGEAKEYVFRFAYDDLDRLQRKTLPDNRALIYVYGEGGELKRVALAEPDGGRRWLVLETRQPAAGEISAPVLGNFTHGRLSASPASPDASAALSRDAFGRLAAVDHPLWRAAYRYDAGDDRIDSRLSTAEGEAVQRWSYLPGTHKIAESRMRAANGAEQTQVWEHDPSGRVTRMGERHLRYGANGRVEAVYRGNALIAEYRYNAGGERVAKTLYRQGVAVTTHYLYSGGRVVAEADASTGRVARHYVYVAGVPVAVVQPGGGGAAGQVVYLHSDPLGTPLLGTDERGRVLWRAAHGPFGEKTAGAADTGNVVVNLRFPGQYFDEETGTHYNYFRDYDPNSGRYLQPDPQGILGGLNVYAYAANDPTSYSDPLGLMPEPDDTGGVSNPTFFGTVVHIRFAEEVRLLGPSYGANDSRSIPGLGSTWPGLRPDAYFVDPVNRALEMSRAPFQGTLWELKPIGWYWNDAKYKMAEAEVLTYRTTAKRGCWLPGSSRSLTNTLNEITPSRQVLFDGKLWDISYINDMKRDDSGLIFYAKKEYKRKPATEPAPAPVLSEEEKKKLEKSMDEVKARGEKDGLSGIQIAGLLVLIGLAIAALIFTTIGATIAAIVAAVVSTITAALVAVAQGAASLIGALALLFGLGAASTAMAAAEEKGKQKEQGLLDKTIEWFKSWF